MGRLQGWLVRLRALTRGAEADRALAEEMQFHLDCETDKNIALGMKPDDARRRALAAFGGRQRTRDEHRDVRGVRWTEEVASDVRYALRTLARSPVLTGAAVVTLALGIGANTAIFSAVNAVILQPLPFPAADRLVAVWEENPDKGWVHNVAAPANYLDWRAEVSAFQGVAAYFGWPSQSTLAGRGEARLLNTAAVTGNFFAVLGVPAARGRVFRDEETWLTSGPPVAVLSDRLWKDQFGGDTSLVGQTIQLDGRSVEVVGIMPAGFAFPWENVDAWLSVRWDPASVTTISFRRGHGLRVIGRLRPGVTASQANTALQVVVERLKRDFPETNRTMGAGITPLHEFLVGDTRKPLLLLLGAVGLLLLIACANVGNLMLVRAAAREREVALRLALGAGRYRLARQALTESLVLSTIGGIAGLLVGWGCTRALVAIQPPGLLRVSQFGVDWSVLGFVCLIATATGLLFGMAPLWWSRSQRPAAALNDGARGGASGSIGATARWENALVVAEVALALLLTVGAGLLTRSFVELRQVNPGFDPSGVLSVTVGAAGARYDSGDKVAAFFDELMRQARALPGVERVAVTSDLPLTAIGWTSDYAAQGRAAGDFGTEATHRRVSPAYFATMRVPIVSGRPFTTDDMRTAPRVAIINDVVAAKYFHGQDPIGQRIAFDRVPDSNSVWRTIVGVVASEHQTAPGVPAQAEIFEAFAQSRQITMSLLLRTNRDPMSYAPAIRRLIAEMDPTLAVGSIQTMNGVAAASLGRERFEMTLFGAFAILGLTLAIVGVYGVLAQVARRRRREIGIRVALGAEVSQVRWMVVRHGLRLSLTGAVIGVLAALWATRTLQGLLYGVPATDPLTFAFVAALLVATSLLAAWIPATRAGAVDPVVALRE